MSVLTVEQFKQVLPDKFKKTVNQELIDQINTTLGDPNLFEIYRDNLMGYVAVLNDGRYKITDYVNAVKYCSHKIMGSTNIDAFIKTFPTRYSGYLANGTSQKDIASYITAYNKTKLVNTIMEQSLIPSWVLNQDLYQKAINVQADLMLSANSEKVRSDAANSLLNHLKPPEVQKVELAIGLKKDTVLDELKQTLFDLALTQQKVIEAGVVPLAQIAQQHIITVTSDDNDA